MKGASPGRIAVALAICIGLALPFAGLAIVCAQDDVDIGSFVWRRRAFFLAAMATFKQGAVAAIVAFILGWPLGILLSAGGRITQGVALCGALVAWLVPPFLWSIGWSFLRTLFPYRYQSLFDGLTGAVLANLTVQLPLVILATALCLRLLTPSAWEAALLARGPRACAALALRSTWAVALGAAVAGSLLCVGDAGVGQIMGHHGLAGEVFVALATRLDLREAAAKALATYALILPFAGVALYMWSRSSPVWSSLSRGAVATPRAIPVPRGLAVLPVILIVSGLVAPAAGLLTPLLRMRSFPFLAEAFDRLQSSLGVTLTYGSVAGLTAAAGGFLVALCLSRSVAAHPWTRGLLLAWICIPSSVQALGWLAISRQADFLTPLLTTEPGVGVILGIRWIPLATLVLVAPLHSIPQSWFDRRALDGVSWLGFGRAVLVPYTLPWLTAVFAGAAVLALADVTSLMLLQPPGASSFTSHLFAIMDNSSDVVVASLCVALATLVTPWALLTAASWSLRPSCSTT